MRTLSVTCREPEGTIERTVTPLIFTVENTRKLYEKASQFPVLFGKPLRDIDDMLARFFWYDSDGLPQLHGPVWQVDDLVGVFFLTDLYEEEATAHFAFFDRRFRGRHKLVKSMIRYVFDKLKYQRLNALIPAYAGEAVNKFVLDCGFKREGRKRAAAFYKDQWFDVNCYGILRSEVIKDGRESN